MAFEPKILGFLCNWCSYSAADSAGASHREYPANLRVVRVMCSGRVDPVFALQALAGGMDGVLICGCHPGDCHYISGNCRTLGRFELLKRMLAAMGVEPERLRVEWVSAQEADRFAAIVEEMTEQIRALGPLDRGTLAGASPGGQSEQVHARGA
jgi:F420-non-reducing hydrogenase iron-sulfur subunit